MATLRLSPAANCLHRLSPKRLPNPPHHHHNRTFLTPPTQNLAASRTLPYPAPAIYSIIADVPSYSTFLPYCTSSAVTAWSRPDGNGTKWPSEARLTVGWKGFEESFTSRIYCVPGTIVEAVGGTTGTRLKREGLEHYDFDAPAPREAGSGILNHLLTRWTVRPVPLQAAPSGGARGAASAQDRTEVSLNIEFQFANPVYSAMSGAVADKVAGVMIEAFEKRVKAVLDSKGEGIAAEGAVRREVL